jgi:hypothetical protein
MARLHPSIGFTPEQRAQITRQLAAFVATRAALPARSAATDDTIEIPLTTVSAGNFFKALVNVTAGGTPTTLELDSGSTALVLPDAAALEGQPGYSVVTTLGEDGKPLTEPFGCPAKLMKGPIELSAAQGPYTIPDCVFYACTGPRDDGCLTKNFGLGRISPWRIEGPPNQPEHRAEIKVAFCYEGSYPYAGLHFAPAATLFSSSSEPLVTQGATLVLSKTQPVGYQWLDIVPHIQWMAVRPRSLRIGQVATAWPGNLDTKPIAMVDCGGGPLFLSDPKGGLAQQQWPPADCPRWTSNASPKSTVCHCTKDDVEVVLSDDGNGPPVTLQVNVASLPPALQDLTLVMCERCGYMWTDDQGRPNEGMNLGGLTFLTNSIAIDLGGAKVGFRPKAPGLI